MHSPFTESTESPRRQRKSQQPTSEQRTRQQCARHHSQCNPWGGARMAFVTRTERLRLRKVTDSDEDCALYVQMLNQEDWLR